MDYLRLGEMLLAVKDGVHAFSEKKGYNYAEHSISTGKPVLQSMGETLSEITLSISLHKMLGHDVVGMLTLIDKMVRDGKPLRLIFADGVYKGNYVIRERTVTVTRTAANGTITAADFELALSEFCDRVLINNRYAEKNSTNSIIDRQILEK